MATNDLVQTTNDLLNIKDFEDARATIKKYARQTPMIQSMFLSRNVTGGNVYLKLENMQLTGSFKFRGANNAMQHLTEEQKQKLTLSFLYNSHFMGLTELFHYA